MIIPIPLLYSNAYLLQSSSSTILIDTGSENQHKRVLSAIRKVGLGPSDISLVLHTHIHPDHCGSTIELVDRMGTPTLIHTREYKSLTSGFTDSIIAHDWEGRLLKKLVLPMKIAFFEPGIQINDPEFSLQEFGVNATAYLTPGHTMGSISVVDHDSSEAVVGDVIMGGYFFNLTRRSYPRFHFFIQDRSLLRQSLKKLIALNLKKWHPGHGDALDPRLVQRNFADFLI